MNNNALIILAPGFEEVEAITIIDLLRRADIPVTTASISEKTITGSHGVTIEADELIDDCINRDFFVIILPGGQPGTNNLKESEKVIALLKKQSEKKRLIAAICAAPTVLEKAGLTKGKKVTSYPTEEKVFVDSEYVNDRIVQDGNIITSRALGTAIDFSLYLIKSLCGEEKATEISNKILHSQTRSL
ncbi:MAG: DJ-1/PfpI family protein [Calditrichaeota bacterium]|nr:MAG: DJ-1/PfpI family protein [Calditrichota bacterium]MBL1205423.1 DJ-1/PfpI family protein [Calditrichota bacterium]NOG45252.1 DJ-1/PfpI family protein [Calditrichota bacterium]